MKIVVTSLLVLVAIAAAAIGFHWTVNRIYVPQGQSLQLRYKGPFFMSAKYAEKGYWAQEGEVGVREKLRGPGRHFYSPIWWERTLVDDHVIEPGQVGIVTCKLGIPLPKGQFLVDGDIGNTKFKGVLRKVLGPGRYRINPYGYEVKVVGTVQKDSTTRSGKHSGWVEIPTGYVGVVTNLADNPNTNPPQQKGIQKDVLPPGIFLINGREQQVDIVEIGYRETTVAVEKVYDSQTGKLKLDEAGEPLVADLDDGINFPSSDGFPIQMDFTAIWGLLPVQAPHAVETFGNIQQVEQKVVQPQIESICRNNGSRYTAVQLLVGEDREKFQSVNLDEFQQVLTDKQITLLYGLVRHIYIPREVRTPIQSAFIADELKLTREQEQKTAREEALLREAEKNVELATERVTVDTDRQFQSRLADGDRQSKTIDAQTRRMTAAIERETAELRAQAATLLGEAENKGKQLVEEAKSDRFRLAVEAFGSAEAYNDWTFAENLPPDVDLNLLYAGEGTLWTDMQNVGVRANFDVPQKKSAPEK